MKVFKAIGSVQPDHSVVLQVPEDIMPGDYPFIVVVDDIPGSVAENDSQTERTAGLPNDFLAQFAGLLADTDLIEPEDPLL